MKAGNALHLFLIPEEYRPRPDHITGAVCRLKRDTENAKTGQRKYEKTIFRILCVKPPISGGFLSMFKTLPKPFESSLQSISLQELALSFRVLCIDVSVTVTSCATECLCNQSEIPGAFHIPLA